MNRRIFGVAGRDNAAGPRFGGGGVVGLNNAFDVPCG